jgi:hypothetical protein
MRTILATCSSLVVCVGLVGCDQGHGQARAPTTVAARTVIPPCNCKPAETASAASVGAHHRHHHSRSERPPYSKTASNSKSWAALKGNAASVREYRRSDEEQDANDVTAEEQMARTATNSGDAGIDGPSGGARTAVEGPARVDQHRHRRHSWSGRLSYPDRRSNTESSSYSEHASSSAGEYGQGDEDQESGDVTAEGWRWATKTTSAGVWIDGYGRPHYPDYGPLGDEHPGLISRKDQRVRAEAWHGYDSDCKSWTN